MADTDDDITLKDGSNTDFVAATDYVGGRHHPLVKIEFGANDTATLVSSANPLPVTVNNANANGSATSANSAPVVIASDQAAVKVKNGQGEYETVAASQTDQVIGATGASGDYLSHVTVIPATTSPGVVTIKDNSTAVISFPGGTLPSVLPFTIYVGAYSTSGAWKITTGTNVSCVAVGDFT